MCFVPLSCWHSVLFFLRMCQYKTLIYKKLLWVKKFSGYLAAMTWGAEEIVDLQPEVAKYVLKAHRGSQICLAS